MLGRIASQRRVAINCSHQPYWNPQETHFWECPGGNSKRFSREAKKKPILQVGGCPNGWDPRWNDAGKEVSWVPALPPDPPVCPPIYSDRSCMLPAPRILPWLPCYNCLYLNEPQDKVKPLCFGCFHQLCHQSHETVINTAGKLW